MLPQLNITQGRIKLEANTDLVISVLRFTRLCLRETFIAVGSRSSGNVLFPMNLDVFLSFFLSVFLVFRYILNEKKKLTLLFLVLQLIFCAHRLIAYSPISK